MKELEYEMEKLEKLRANLVAYTKMGVEKPRLNIYVEAVENQKLHVKHMLENLCLKFLH